MSAAATRAVHLEHVGLRTTAATFEPTVRLYTEVFGWRVIEERPSTGPDDRVSFLADGAGGAFEVFVSSSSAGVIDDPAHIAFAVPFAEFDALAERLKQAGVTLDPPFINDVGDQISFFNDPAGNRAQIVGRLKTLPSRDA
jgi:catechol 2,3-dioxygenase-like lactoylglutathione lyase family enzyme